LIITADDSGQYIQSITGATISSAAVAQSVRTAIMSLEEAVGGFEEDVE
jgi:Na+-translocating ferredoxin:NAD+ oxidoreductase RnfG subunit